MKTRKKIVSMLLAFALVFSLVPTALAAESSYQDTDGHWAEAAIERWSDYGVIQGNNGSFNPNGSLTRAHMAAVLSRLLNLPEAPDAGFADVKEGDWHAEYINKCAAAGIMLGSDGKANPNAPITRQQAIVMLGRALGIQPVENPDLSNFQDGTAISDYAKGYVAAMNEAGIVGGITSDTLGGGSDITRAQTVTILNRAIGTYANETGTTVEASSSGITLVAADNVTVTGTADSVLVSQGAQDGTVTLSSGSAGSVTVTAENATVYVTSESKADDVTLTETAVDSKVVVLKGAEVGTVTTAAPGSTVSVSGKVDTVATTATAEKASVEVAKNATVGEIAASGEKTAIAVSGKVDSVTVSDTATDTTVKANSGSTISKVDNAAEGTTVSGSGKVENVTTSGDNTTVSTPGTKVEADKGTSGTTAGGKDVAGGSSTTTGGSTSGGSSSGGSSHSHSYTSSVTTAATCTTAGVRTYTCSCGVSYTEEIPATGHNFVDGVCSVCRAIDPAALVTDETTLTAALADSTKAVIVLGANIDLNKELVINRPVTINGNKNVITTLFTAATGTGDPVPGKHAVCVQSTAKDSTVTLKDLTINSDSKTYGLNVWQAGTVALENVTIQKSKGSGLTINDSIVTASGLDVSNSGWSQSVNIDQKTADVTTSFTLTSGNLEDTLQITSDAGTVTVNVPEGYAEFKTQATGDKRIWNKLFAGGDGTAEHPFEIETAKQFADIYYAYDGYHYKLTKDITVSYAYKASWAYVATPYLYNGTFDGNNHTITVSDSSRDVNLFNYIYNSTIKDLNVVLDYSLAVYCDGEVTFDHVDVSGEFTVGGNEGAYTIYDFATTLNFLDCVADVDMSGTSYNAVFVGYVNWPQTSVGTLNFIRCENKGSLVCNYAAMFIGNPNAYNIVCNAVDCVNSGTIQATNTEQVFNYYYAVTSNCYGDFMVNGTVYKDIADGRSSAPTCAEDTVVTTTGQAIQGPLNTNMTLTQNADKTFTITDATIEGKTVDHYTVYVGVYAALKAGGSSRNYVTETISASAENKTTALKNLSFVDTQWVEEHSGAVQGELAGNVTYTLNDETYYMLVTPETDTLNGKTKAPQMIYVVAYDASNKTLASATLFGNIA